MASIIWWIIPTGVSSMPVHPLRSFTWLAALGACLLVQTTCRADIIYVGNQGNATVTKIDNGTPSIISTGNVTPFGLAVDGAGDLFVTDGGTILKVTPGGMVSTIFHQTGLSFGGLAADSAGDVFLADRGTGIVREIGSAGGPASIFATGLQGPWALAFGPGGNLFAIDEPGGRSGEIVQVTSSSITPIVTGISLSAQFFLAIDQQGDFAAMTTNFNVQEYSPTGAPLAPNPFYSGFPDPLGGLAFGSNGHLFVVDTRTGAYDVLELDKAGNVVGTLTGFSMPQPIAIFAPVASAVPEPASFALFGIGLAGLAVARFRRSS
jgi:DNA-binding beta-propeller fold protein YncE